MRAAYGAVEVLHGVDLSLDAGETLGVVGPNGAGKSTLLRAICGLTTPSCGEVELEGRPLRGLAPEQIARLGVGLVPEGRQIFGRLTVAENLRLGSRGKGGARLREMLERFPILGERGGQRAERLSGGEQQQLAIARALLGEPQLLILDEPSLGLAPTMIDVIYELLASLHEEGLTMLLVEQNAARTIAFCERTAILSGGQIRAIGNHAELLGDPEVLRAYLGRQL